MKIVPIYRALAVVIASVLGWSLAGSVAAAPPFANYGLADLTDLSYSLGTVLFYALYRALGADDFDETYRRP